MKDHQVGNETMFYIHVFINYFLSKDFNKLLLTQLHLIKKIFWKNNNSAYCLMDVKITKEQSLQTLMDNIPLLYIQ